MSPFGFHLANPDGWLVLDQEAWSLSRPDGTRARGVLTPPEVTTFERAIELMRPGEEGPEEVLEPVGYLQLTLASELVVAFAAPVGAARATPAPQASACLHGHPPEGAALVAHLARHLDRGGLPASCSWIRRRLRARCSHERVMTKHLSEAERRSQILRAARAVFIEKGFLAARVEDVAKRASLSKGAVYFYFSSKRDLFMALVQEEHEATTASSTRPRKMAARRS